MKRKSNKKVGEEKPASVKSKTTPKAQVSEIQRPLPIGFSVISQEEQGKEDA